ncbi:hypothetical protein [Kitasatospora azatica]|uniref:hypothetical protein n=1 Tax=Kitasatospora azatica TaxID=58347 RepID=UPI0005629D4E|nr:hypothetical protein [Kitasatospora azatica]
MTDWATISSLATAGATLVLAVATFASVHSANRAARSAEGATRIAERSLLSAQRPLLVTSRAQDPEQRIEFAEGKSLLLPGGGAAVEVTEGILYMALAVRNVGTGLAILHSWYMSVGERIERTHPPLEAFTAHVKDIFVAPGDHGFWQGAFRDPTAEQYAATAAAISAGDSLMLDVLYSDYEGGQRVISQFVLRLEGGVWQPSVVRHFNVDRPDPR